MNLYFFTHFFDTETGNFRMRLIFANFVIILKTRKLIFMIYLLIIITYEYYKKKANF